ncbi:MAG: XdhC family protein [Saprospiraceae bacterium]|nr:XdhC family protein [Saprospiraceae bacterium]
MNAYTTIIMQEFLQKIDEYVAQKQKFATATVISTWGSAPRQIGSMMLIGEDGTMSGSVSGGCVEVAVVRLAKDILAKNTAILVNFGVSDNEAWSVGLSCGGSIEVFIEPFWGFEEPEIWEILRGCLAQNTGAILLTKLSNNKAERLLVLPNSNEVICGTANEALFTGEAAISEDLLLRNDFLLNNAATAYQERKTKKLDADKYGKWFTHVFAPKHRIIIIGAAHITVDLVHLAHYFGFETLVIDPRGIFATKTDFPTTPNALHVDWPAEILPDLTLDAYTYAVLLTHDPKIDDQALHLLLRSNVAYIGALGSKKTHEKRLKRLAEAGFTPEECAKINAPVGVNINAKSAREIAMSIIGALIQAKNAFL